MQIHPQDIKKILQTYDHILLTAHVSPDGDAVGSVLALYGCLCQWGKHPVLVIDDEIEEKYKYLPAAAQIRKPQEVQTDASWLTVILDATDTARIGRTAALIKGKVLNIDHHISNRHFADWEYVLPAYAAAGEVLTELFLQWSVSITPEMADALYTAIATDCGFFKFGNTTAHTLRMAAAAVAAGARPARISESLEARDFADLTVLSEVLRHIERFADGRMAGIVFTPELLALTGDHTGSYIDYVRIIKGVDVAFTVRYVTATETRLSLRSKHTDVNAIAAVFGGGGHIRAAGATVSGSLQETKEKLIKEIINAL